MPHVTRSYSWITGVTVLIGATSIASANTISPTLVTIPGMGVLGLHVAFTLSILAAFVERPFVSRAGVTRFALCASLQANFLSTLIGLLFLPVAVFAVYAFEPSFPYLLFVWWAVAVWLSYRYEFYWYRRRFGGPGITLLRGPIAWGNIISNALFLAILVVTEEPTHDRLRWLRSLEPWLTIATSVACGAVYLAAFLIPKFSRKHAIDSVSNSVQTVTATPPDASTMN
jgi:hypothetical protein